MVSFPIFLSVVLVVRNRADPLDEMLRRISRQLTRCVADHELIIVDNASTDESVALLKNLSGPAGLPNLQVYALTNEVSTDTASWVGLENALGDFVAVIDPLSDDIAFLPQMLDKAVSGSDVVFANNLAKSHQSLLYRCAYGAFSRVFAFFSGVHLAKEAPQYRVLSKTVVNFILQHRQPAITYRHLPATGGFARTNLEYSTEPLLVERKSLTQSISRGLRLLVSTTQAPIRLVTTLSLFGATANLLYSIYVVIIGIFKSHVAPGWISLSLQQSGMFFLISLVLLVLGEYIMQMAALSNEGPHYHVGQEFTSVHVTRREKLNIETASQDSLLSQGRPEQDDLV